MTSEELVGLVIFMNSQKQLIQTRKIRIYQRENLVDKMKFLIPLNYQGEDLTPYQVTLQYVDTSGTVHYETLKRATIDPEESEEPEYDDYEDKAGNKTHMVYILDVNSKLTLYPGDITLKLSMNYVDYEGQTVASSNDEPAPDPEPRYHILNTGETIVSILPVADYYSIVPDEVWNKFDTELAKLDAKQKEIEATAEIYDREKADGIEIFIDKYNQCIRLTSHGEQVGEAIDLNDLGEAVSDWTESGLVRVITDEEDPEPGPTPSGDYANDIALVVNENTKAIYLLSNGKMIGTPIYLENLGTAISDATEEGLIKVITDDDNSVITGD